jgi:uncharacterized protein (DUF433 family)
VKADQLIIQKKGILGGKPIIKGTRISVDLIGSYIANDHSSADIKQAYPFLSDTQISAALIYLEEKSRSARVSLVPTTS